jgi:signal peptidase I
VKNRSFATAAKTGRRNADKIAQRGRTRDAEKRMEIQSHHKAPSTDKENISGRPSSCWTRWLVLPLRYRSTGSPYTREQLIAVSQRIPLWLALAIFVTWEETSPYKLVKIHGPSMLPTMAPDGSEIWLSNTMKWRQRLFGFFWQEVPLAFETGDLVGFAHPDFSQHVACKRIVGMPGEVVKRYGQYVHLYVDQDPYDWGIQWPDTKKRDENGIKNAHAWIDRKCAWDQDFCLRHAKDECHRTIVVPQGHVWVEGDCPAMSIDSRQFGPIPLKWLKGKVVSRLWPVGTEPGRKFLYKCRPHPIPLDEENLRLYNVHRISPKN